MAPNSPPSSLSRPTDGRASKTKEPMHVPTLAVDEEGTIQHVNAAARRVLEHPPDESIGACLFSHVHGHNLRRVMRDLAHMVRHRKQRARWLLRLRTGTGRWRWYRAVAHNRLDEPESVVAIHLRPL